jgi:hypothetical protein
MAINVDQVAWIFIFINSLKEGSLFIIQELYLLGP